MKHCSVVTAFDKAAASILELVSATERSLAGKAIVEKLVETLVEEVVTF